MTENVVEPDVEDFDESEDSRDIEAQEVSGAYVEPEKSQDPELGT